MDIESLWVSPAKVLLLVGLKDNWELDQSIQHNNNLETTMPYLLFSFIWHYAQTSLIYLLIPDD